MTNWIICWKSHPSGAPGQEDRKTNELFPYPSVRSIREGHNEKGRLSFLRGVILHHQKKT